MRGVVNQLPAEGGQDQAVEDVNAELVFRPAPGCVRSQTAPQPGQPGWSWSAGVYGPASHPYVKELIIVPDYVDTDPAVGHCRVGPVGEAVQGTVSQLRQRGVLVVVSRRAA